MTYEDFLATYLPYAPHNDIEGARTYVRVVDDYTALKAMREMIDGFTKRDGREVLWFCDSRHIIVSARRPAIIDGGNLWAEEIFSADDYTKVKSSWGLVQ